MVIKEMRPEYSKDWFDFFDNRGFADHEDWKGCYCTFFFTPRMKEYGEGSRKRRDYAKWLVENGIMKGYLAYEYGKVVGWCNVNDKRAFTLLDEVQTDEDKVLSIACFLLQKDYRGKGLAQKILDRIIEDARKRNIKIIEAYPRPKATSQFGNYRGPYSMYEKNGFKLEKVRDANVVRRYL